MHRGHSPPLKRKWAQIEQEVLATLYGVECFDQYTYGRKVIIENDHKSLEAIMKLYRYDIEFSFLKGTTLVIVDTLSETTWMKTLHLHRG